MIHDGPIKHCSFCKRPSTDPKIVRMIEAASGKCICSLCVPIAARASLKAPLFLKVVQFPKA